MKYVASGHMIINILKKNSFLSICTGVSWTLQTTLDTRQLGQLQHEAPQTRSEQMRFERPAKAPGEIVLETVTQVARNN